MRNRKSLLFHIRNRHTETTKFTCSICNDVYTHDFSLRRHMKIKHPEIKTNPHREDDIEFPDYVEASCEMCSITKFASYKKMRSHYLDVHNSGVGPVMCCSKEFNFLTLLKDHIALHKNPDFFK